MITVTAVPVVHCLGGLGVVRLRCGNWMAGMPVRLRHVFHASEFIPPGGICQPRRNFHEVRENRGMLSLGTAWIRTRRRTPTATGRQPMDGSDPMTSRKRISTGTGLHPVFLVLAVAVLLLGFVGMHAVAMGSAPMGMPQTSMSGNMASAEYSASGIHSLRAAGEPDSGNRSADPAPAMPCGNPTEPGTGMATPCVPLQSDVFSAAIHAESRLQPSAPSMPVPAALALPADVDPQPPSLEQLSIDRR